MATVEAIALTDFVHNDIEAREGRLVRHRSGELISDHIAADLERAGLVRIRTQAPVPQPAVKAAAGKAADDGAGQPSSASQAAPASQTVTSSSFKPGVIKSRKPGA